MSKILRVFHILRPIFHKRIGENNNRNNKIWEASEILIRNCTRLLCDRGHRNMKGLRSVFRILSNKSGMELFAKITNRWSQATTFANSSTLNVWLGSEYASVKEYRQTCIRRPLSGPLKSGRLGRAVVL